MYNNKTYYIISVSHPTCGILALWKNTVAHILYAYDKGYIPVVDLKHYQNQYFKNKKEYIDNTWEYFFKQPADISIENIPQGAEIIISDNISVPDSKYGIYPEIIPISPSKVPINSELFNRYKKYLIFTDEILEYIYTQYKNLIGDKKNILGVLCRGTDYLSLKPAYHQIQPNPKDVIAKIKEVQKTHNFEYIYLATEDANIYKLFKQEFGDRLIDNNQYRYSKVNDFISKIETKEKNHLYNLAKDYLLSIYILSKCKYFISGRTAGTLGVYLLTDGFEYDYVYDLGRYAPFPKKQIFSFSKDNKHIILTIFGIKIKFKRRKND